MTKDKKAQEKPYINSQQDQKQSKETTHYRKGTKKYRHNPDTPPRPHTQLTSQ